MISLLIQMYSCTLLLAMFSIPSCVVSLNVHFKVNEGVPVKFRLGSIQDHISPTILRYQNDVKFIIMNTDKSQFFVVNELSGEVRVAKDIDREELCPTSKVCRLEFTVNCLHRQNIAEIIEVTVTIDDVNDNKCFFIPTANQTVTWREDYKIEETSEFINRPRDNDVFFSILQSTISIKSDGDKFALRIIVTGSLDVPFNLELVLKSELDYEIKKFHNIIISASDGLPEHQCQLNITVAVTDINDNSPRFPRDFYSISIPENFPQNQTIVRLQATDKDSGVHAEIFYEIDTYVDHNVNVNFHLDQQTGDLFLRRELNYYNCRSYLITIEARNRDMRSRFGTTKVLINVTDINNEAPEITLFSSITGTNKLTIEENQSTEKDVAMVSVSDKDTGINAKVRCVLQNQSVENLIELRETILQNTFRIVVIRAIDREEIDRISAILVCNDLGQPSLTTTERITITVLDQNDNTPVFQNIIKAMTIFEDTESSRVAMNFRILRFQAIDRDFGHNAHLSYSIYSTDTRVKDSLKIDVLTGVLSSNGNIDREKIENLAFKVSVSDGGEPPLVAELDFQLNIDDFNDHAPRFSEMSRYNFQIYENRPDGELVGVMFAKDLDFGDNGRVAFYLEHPLASIPFKLISKRNPYHEKKSQWGEFQYRIEVRSTATLDRESIFAMNQIYPKYDFIVRAEDHGMPKLTHRISVQIDVLDENDIVPDFDFSTRNISQITLSCYEGTNHKFGKIGAYDQDDGPNGTLQFAIKSGDPTMKFYLDPINGDLRLAKKLSSIDIKEYELIIEVKDMGTPPLSRTIKIVIKVDDSPPLGHQSEGYTSSVEMLNLYIIIAIVVASFIISIVLLTAICLVLQRSRSHTQSNSSKLNHRHTMEPENYFGPDDLAIANYHVQQSNLSRTASINLLPVIPDNIIDTGGYCMSNMDQSKFDTATNDFYRILNTSYQPFNMDEVQTNDKDSGKGDSVDARVLYQHLDSSKLYGIFDSSNLVSGPIATSRMINNGPPSPYNIISARRPLITATRNGKSPPEPTKVTNQVPSTSNFMCNVNNGSFV